MLFVKHRQEQTPCMAFPAVPEWLATIITFYVKLVHQVFKLALDRPLGSYDTSRIQLFVQFWCRNVSVAKPVAWLYESSKTIAASHAPEQAPSIFVIFTLSAPIHALHNPSGEAFHHRHASATLQKHLQLSEILPATTGH